LNVARRVAVAVLFAAISAGVFFLGFGYGDDSFLLGGIQVNEADHEQWFAALGRACMNTVAATVYAKQGDWDSDHLWWEDEEPSVVQEIRGAKSRGLKVVLIPRVALDHAFPRNRFLWHGLILPRNDELIESWFDSYGKFLVKWGEIAEREGVDVFAVGSEMNALASTVPLAALPPLEEYYLDREKQAAKKEAYLETGGNVDAESLVIRGGERFASLESFLEAETSAHEAWADQTVFGLEGDALARLNERRRRLDVLWRRTIDAVRAVYGGVSAGLAIFLWLCAARSEWQRPGLLAALLTFGGLVVARSISWLVAGSPGALGLALHVLELAGLVLCAVALRIRAAQSVTRV